MKNFLLILVLILVVSCAVEPKQDQRARILEDLRVIGDDIQSSSGIFHVVIEGNNRDQIERDQNNTKPGFHRDFSNEATFMPNNIEITLGDSVIWTNKDGIEHTITFQDGFDEKLPIGGIAQRKFSEIGFYHYYSRYQPQVKGIVIVNKNPT